MVNTSESVNLVSVMMQISGYSSMSSSRSRKDRGVYLPRMGELTNFSRVGILAQLILALQTPAAGDEAPAGDEEPAGEPAPVEEKQPPEGALSAPDILSGTTVIAHGMGAVGNLNTLNCLEGFLTQLLVPGGRLISGGGGLEGEADRGPLRRGGGGRRGKRQGPKCAESQQRGLGCL